MITALRYESRRVLTLRRLLWPGIACLLGALSAIMVTAAVVGGVAPGAAPTPSEAIAFVLGRGSIMPAVAGVAAAMLIGAEFRHQTVQLTLAVTPRPRVVVCAYLGVQSAMATVLGVLGAALSVAVVGVGLGLWSAPAAVAAAVGTHVFTCVVWSVWGGVSVLIVRSRTVAVTVLLCWTGVVEPSVGGVAAVAGDERLAAAAAYLPFALLGSLTRALAPSDGVLLGGGTGPGAAMATAVIVVATAMLAWFGSSRFAAM